MKRIFETIDQTGEFAQSPAYGDYQEIVREVAREAEELARGGRYDPEFFRAVDMFVRYGDFKKVGQGSSRKTYRFGADERYVLKFAYNESGLKQNQTEIKNARLGDYSCMSRILDHDPLGVLIVADYCRPSTYDDWRRIVGMPPSALAKVVKAVVERRKTDRKYSVADLLEELKDPYAAAKFFVKTSPMDTVYSPSDHKGIVDGLENLVKAANGADVPAGWKAMYDVFRFYFDNGLAAMVQDELLYTEQWGVRTGPDGREQLVIIDPGVDEDFSPVAGTGVRIGA